MLNHNYYFLLSWRTLGKMGHHFGPPCQVSYESKLRLRTLWITDFFFLTSWFHGVQCLVLLPPGWTDPLKTQMFSPPHFCWSTFMSSWVVPGFPWPRYNIVTKTLDFLDSFCSFRWFWLRSEIKKDRRYLSAKAKLFKSLKGTPLSKLTVLMGKSKM